MVPSIPMFFSALLRLLLWLMIFLKRTSEMMSHATGGAISDHG
jgi:hypothetical protein